MPSTSAFVYDTLIFIAISFRLATNAVTEKHGWRSRALSITTGQGLFNFSKSLMIHGQLYYLCALSKLFELY